MISNKLKVVLGMYLVTLLVMLFVGSVTAGLITLTMTGALAVVAASYIINYIKNFDVPLRSKMLSVLLVNTILYSTILIFFSLSKIDLGDMGMLILFIMFVGSIFVIISVLNGLSLVVHNKVNTTQGDPNKKLLPFALILLLVLLYLTGFLVTGIAKLVGDPALCSFQVEPRERVNERKVVDLQDFCISSVAQRTLSVNDCKQMKGQPRGDGGSDSQFINYCIRDVAIRSGDTQVCRQMEGDSNISGCMMQIIDSKMDPSMCSEFSDQNGKDVCYSSVARTIGATGGNKNGDPEKICNFIKSSINRYSCLSVVAMQKKDTGICEKYFSDEILTNETMSPDYYSKKLCIKSVEERIIDESTRGQ